MGCLNTGGKRRGLSMYNRKFYTEEEVKAVKEEHDKSFSKIAKRYLSAEEKGNEKAKEKVLKAWVKSRKKEKSLAAAAKYSGFEYYS